MLASSLPAVIQGIPRSAPVVASAVADPAGIHRDALLWLADLIRINTSNPPGSEQLAAKYVAGVLQKEGIKPELLDLALGRSAVVARDRKSTRLNSSHLGISYAVFCLKKKIRYMTIPH